MVAEAAAVIRPAVEAWIRQVAQGEVLHNDDTPLPVLALGREGERAARDLDKRAEPSQTSGAEQAELLAGHLTYDRRQFPGAELLARNS